MVTSDISTSPETNNNFAYKSNDEGHNFIIASEIICETQDWNSNRQEKKSTFKPNSSVKVFSTYFKLFSTN